MTFAILQVSGRWAPKFNGVSAGCRRWTSAHTIRHKRNLPNEPHSPGSSSSIPIAISSLSGNSARGNQDASQTDNDPSFCDGSQGTTKAGGNGLGQEISGQRRPRGIRRFLPSVIFSPSDYLIAALRDGGHYNSLPMEPQNKLNLSSFNPLSLDRQNLSQAHRAARRALQPPSKKVAASLSLSSILADHIRFLHAPLHKSIDSTEIEGSFGDLLPSVYNEPTLEYLCHRGYSAQDVMTWAWIITSKTSDQVSQRLNVAALDSHEAPIPDFVFLLVLRRKRLSAQALQLLMIHGWDRVLPPSSINRISLGSGTLASRFRVIKRSDMGNYKPMDYVSFVVMIVRLMRHARRVWSPGLPSIANIISTYHGDMNHRDTTCKPLLDAEAHFKLTSLLNRCLSLLAIPSSISPFASIPYHQRAQFRLLQMMADLQPPVLVNKEGYRAIIRVQVAHRKTIHEREWARYKAKSWPPWKQEKLGIDAERGDEGKISRATETMTRMQEAGYDHQQYEQVASIFAGWDTDRSPTIQTLKTLPTASAVSFEGLKSKQSVWAARIRATRTLNEAWACFLAHEDAKMPPSMDLYHAMSEKIIFSKKSGLVGPASLGGDGMEVLPEPISPNDTTYVRLRPPSMALLSRNMLSQGIRPAGRFLAFLLNHADSLETGLKYLRRSSLSTDQINALTDYYQVPQNAKVIQLLPDYIFGAFIRLLCHNTGTFLDADSFVGAANRSKTALPSKIRKIVPKSRGSSVSQFQERVNPLAHALELMHYRLSQYRPPWNDVLAALANTNIHLGSARQMTPALTTWKAIDRVLYQMKLVDIDLDFKGFHIACVGLEKAILASHRLISALARARADHIDSILFSGVGRLKREFERLVATSDKPFHPTTSQVRSREEAQVDPNILIPQILSTPDPAHLHALIRVMGVAGDTEGLLSLLEWMNRFQPELQAAVDERANGAKLINRTLVAMRVFLEQSWRKREATETGAGKDTILSAREIMAEMTEWGGWASDEDVESYLQKGATPD